MDSRLSMVLMTYTTRPFLRFLTAILVGTMIGATYLVVQLPVAPDWQAGGDASGYGVLYGVVGYLSVCCSIFVLVQVSQQFQHVHSKLLPGYAAPHQIVAGGFMTAGWLFAVGVLACSSSPAAACLIIPSVFLAAGFAVLSGAFPPARRTLLNQVFLFVGSGPAVVLITLLASGAISVGDLLRSLQPWHVGLAMLQLLLMAVLTVRFLPESIRYFLQSGAQLPAQGVPMWDMPMARALDANPGQQIRGFPMLSSVSESLLTGYHGQRWFSRLRLWQAGGSAGPARLFFAGLIMQLVFTLTLAGFSRQPHERFGIIMLEAGLLLPVVALQSIRTRRLRFAQEWLRPVSRATAVTDLLRGLGWDLLAVPAFVLWAALWVQLTAGSGWTALHWGCLVAAVLGTYLLSVGLVAMLTLARSDFVVIPAALLLILPVLPTAAIFMPPLARSLPQSTWLIGAAIVGLSLSLPGVVLIAIARRQWLNRELG